MATVSEKVDAIYDAYKNAKPEDFQLLYHGRSDVGATYVWNPRPLQYTLLLHGRFDTGMTYAAPLVKRPSASADSPCADASACDRPASKL